MLSKRLKTIASLIEKDETVVDIGCDHALLDIYLTIYNNNKCTASDISEKVIENALKNIKKYKLENKIKTIVSNGAENINIDSKTTMIISGMGATTITNILKNTDHTNIQNLIIQSNNDLEIVRREVVRMGYLIDNELVVFEKNKYYVIIKFIKGIKKYNKYEYKFGPIVMKDKNNKDYIENIILNNKNIIKKLSLKYYKKILNLKKENRYLKKAI